MEEIWKSIEGYEGLYEISNLGNVRSLNYNHTGMTQVLKPGQYSNGYLYVVLCKNRKRKHFRIHRLVASTFIPNPQNLPQVNHKTEIKTDNRVDCLEWCSCEYNNNYGTRNQRAGKANSKTQMNDIKKSKPVLQYTKEGVFIKEFPSVREAERETGISQGNICRCCLGKYKSAGGFVWKYKLYNQFD